MSTAEYLQFSVAPRGRSALCLGTAPGGSGFRGQCTLFAAASGGSALSLGRFFRKSWGGRVSMEHRRASSQ